MSTSNSASVLNGLPQLLRHFVKEEFQKGGQLGKDCPGVSASQTSVDHGDRNQSAVAVRFLDQILGKKTACVRLPRNWVDFGALACSMFFVSFLMNHFSCVCCHVIFWSCIVGILSTP